MDEYLFWNIAKNGTAPLLSIALVLGLFVTVPILVTVKYLYAELNLDFLTFYYLFLPRLLIVTPSMMVLEGLASYKKRKRGEAEEKARIKMKRDNWIANNVKKKKRK